MKRGRPPRGQVRHVDIVCAGCRRWFTRPFGLIRFEANYCTQACWIEATRKRQPPSPATRAKLRAAVAGPRHPRWKGGVTTDRAWQRQSHREWCRRNPDKVHARSSRRTALKKGGVGSHTLEEWLAVKARHEFACLHCHRKEPEIKLTRDHIVPLSKGGTDFISNIQPLCRSCNSRKGARMAA